MRYHRYLTSALTFSIITSNILNASAEKQILREPIEVDEIFEISSSGKNITCGGLIAGRYLSGTIKDIDGATLFIIRNDAVKEAKSRWKKEKNKTKKSKLEKKYLKLAKTVKAENSTCSFGPGGAPPSSSPPPTGPQPTPPPKSLGNFDSSGNVTSDGKVKFGIPSGINANLNSGKTVWNSDCKGCHSSEKTGRSFSFYKSAIKASPMFITDMTDQELADITAYLRRFELN